MIIKSNTPINVFILCIAVLLCSCNTTDKKNKDFADTTSIALADTLTLPPSPYLQRSIPLSPGKLKVLTLHSINSFFVYDGQPKGIEYEIIKHYADSKMLDISIESVHSYGELYDSLAAGNYDVVIGTIIRTNAWEESLAQTVPVYPVDLLLVSADSSGIYESSMHVIKNSPMAFWKEENDSLKTIHSIRYVDEEISKEQALALVAVGKLPNIVVDHHEYLIMEAFFPELNKTFVMAKDQPVSFAFHPDLKDLRDDFNKWFIHWKEKKGEYNYIFKKYRALFEANRNKMRYEKPENILGRISKYDKLVKDHANLNEFDWLLVSALIYQESRFHPDAESPVGARGLMQLMPSVATTYKVSFDRLKDPKKNVEIGTRYLRKLYEYYDKDSSLTKDNKIKFTLASYNAGLGHIIDARALAKKHRLDPNVWDGNVADMLTKKYLGEFNRDPVVKYGHFRGWETYGYVKNIMMYYNHYQDHMEKYFNAETE